MTLKYDPNGAQRLLGQVTKIKPFAWFLSQTMHHLDRAAYDWSNGRVTAASVLTGLPIVILIAKGAKSGKERAIPLVATPNGDDIILIASYYGNKRHPAWYHNLKANPACKIQYDGRTLPFTAREAEGEEKVACWRLATEIFPTYNIYKTRTGGREIPLMILSPAS